MAELKRWCPSLRTIRFYGNREHREELKEKFFTDEAAAHNGKRPERRVKINGEWQDDSSHNPRGWDVCVTTYEDVQHGTEGVAKVRLEVFSHR